MTESTLARRVNMGEHPQNAGPTEFWTPQQIEVRKSWPGIKVNIIQPPELKPDRQSFNSRVEIPLASGSVVFATHMRSKPERPDGCGDNMSSFHFPVKDKRGRYLGDVMGILGVDGVSKDDPVGVKQAIDSNRMELLREDPDQVWDHPDIVFARHAREFLHSMEFDAFTNEAREIIIEAHKTGLKPTIWDDSGGGKELINNLGLNLFGNQNSRYVQFSNRLRKLFNYHPVAIEDWNFNGPFGNVLCYKPNPQYAKKWPNGGEIILASRFQSNADVLAMVGYATTGLAANSEIGSANMNLLTDELIDSLRKTGASPEQIKVMLHKKLSQFSFFPNRVIDRRNIPVIFAGRITSYGYMYPHTSALPYVLTDGIRFKTYRNRFESKDMFDVGEEVANFVDPTTPIDWLDNKLTNDGYNIDDRAIGIMNIK